MIDALTWRWSFPLDFWDPSRSTPISQLTTTSHFICHLLTKSNVYTLILYTHQLVISTNSLSLCISFLTNISSLTNSLLYASSTYVCTPSFPTTICIHLSHQLLHHYHLVHLFILCFLIPHFIIISIKGGTSRKILIPPILIDDQDANLNLPFNILSPHQTLVGLFIYILIVPLPNASTNSSPY